MTMLLEVPTEILSRIIRFLDAKPDVANARLVNRRFDAIAVEVLFETITLYPQWHYEEGANWLQPGPLGYDATVFLSIVNDRILKTLVKKVVLYTVEPHCNYNVHDQDTWHNPPSLWYDSAWIECCDRLHELPHARGATLHFDRNVPSYRFEEESATQGASDRLEVTRKVLRHLEGRCTDLSMRNYENGMHQLPGQHDGDERDQIEEDLKCLWRALKTVTSLRISIVHAEICSDYGTNLRDGAPQRFWGDFPTIFLHPMQQTLNRLVVYSSTRIGFFSSADFRSAHFPHLASLTLGFFTFWRDWQFDWITSHAKTLTEIYLDNCAILRQVYHTNENWLDDDGFPKGLSQPDTDHRNYGEPSNPDDFYPDDLDEVELSISSPYTTRWSHVFTKFAEEIRDLRVFKFGVSEQWDFGASALCLDGCAAVHPTMPWEAEQDIVNEVFEEAYLVYIDWEEEFVVEWDGDVECLTAAHRAMIDPRPQCQEEDSMALQMLLDQVKGHS